jgi:plasmid stabilization system protein ParE
MRKKYTIVWANPAKLDLFEIIEFIAADSPANAQKIKKRIQGKTADLYMNPQRGRAVPELAKQGITVFRELIISPWRVIYKIQGKVVYIELVADGRRNLEDLLFRRIMR